MAKTPKLIFPGKYVVQIQTLTKTEFNRLGPPHSAAFWILDDDGSGGSIYLREATKTAKEDLKHELQHALVDWLEFYFT